MITEPIERIGRFRITASQRVPTKQFSGSTKNSGNLPLPKVPPTNNTGGVMDIVAACLALFSIGIFAAHTLDALRAG